MQKRTRSRWLYAAGGVISGFLNGLFGSGGGTVIVPFLEKFTGLNPKKSHATAIFIIAGFTVVSLIFYGFSDRLPLTLGFQTSLGGVVGGFLGAKLLSRLSFRSIHIIFGICMLVAAGRMVFF